MTVSNTTSRNQYTATSGQTVFPYSFEIFDKDDVAVLKNGAFLSEGTDYTVSGVGNDSGGNITLTVGATAGDILTIYRDMAYQRLTDYQNSGDFLAQEVNDDFDRLWLAVQQNNEGNDRAIVKPITDSASIDMTLPSAVDRANSYLTFDATGAPSVVAAGDPSAPDAITRQDFTGDGATLVYTLASAPGAAGAGVMIFIDGIQQDKDSYTITGTTLTFSEAPPLNSNINLVQLKATDIGEADSASVTYIPAGTGAVETTVQSKLRETVSVKDFGAVGDGVADDTAAIQAALDAVINIGIAAGKSSKSLYIPAGTYFVTQLTIGGIGAVVTSDAYNKIIHCDGEIIGTNTSGAIVLIEGAYPVTYYGLRVTNLSTATGSKAVEATRSYACNYFGCKFEGGEYAFTLQGNLNNFNGCTFLGASRAGFAMLGNSANCLVNLATGCDFEDNSGYGIEINRTTGTPYFDFVMRSCYFESNSLGHAYIYNNLGDVSFESCYFAMNDDLIDGIVYGGTITSKINNKSRIENCIFNANVSSMSFNCVSMASGTADSAMGGVSYLGNRLVGLTNSNTVLGFTEAYSGSSNRAVKYAVNKEAKLRAVNIVNFDFSSLTAGAGSAPTDWISAGGTLITGATISDYGWGNKAEMTVSISQAITIKPNTLYELSVFSAVNDPAATARADIKNISLSTTYLTGTANQSTTPVHVKDYWFSGAQTNVAIALTELGGLATDTASFSEIRLVDLSS